MQHPGTHFQAHMISANQTKAVLHSKSPEQTVQFHQGFQTLPATLVW